MHNEKLEGINNTTRFVENYIQNTNNWF